MRLSEPFLTAVWRHLLIVNYEVPPELLLPLCPTGTVLDLWQGHALVSIVGFRFLQARLRWASIPGHRDFDEVNLRFYVRHRAADGTWRRGVTFIREFVPRAMIATIARWRYNEPYLSCPMRHRLDMAAAGAGDHGSVSYSWHTAGRWQSFAGETVGHPALPPAGSEAAFTIEHYWGYTAQRSGGTREYHVSHVPWRIWTVSDCTVTIDIAAVYGPIWSQPLAKTPTLALVAEGSPVAIYPGHSLPPGGSLSEARAPAV